MFVLRHCLPKYLVCIFNSFSTYSCIRACRTFNVRFNIGAALKTTNIITRECFHFVNLLSIRSKFIHENIFRHEYGAVSPITKLSGVNSGGESPIMHDGKSNIGMLQKKSPHMNYEIISYTIELIELTHFSNPHSPTSFD